MANSATAAKRRDDDGLPDEASYGAVPAAPATDDVKRVAVALVQIDAWCRQRGLEELARLLEPAVDWSDRALTGA